MVGTAKRGLSSLGGLLGTSRHERVSRLRSGTLQLTPVDRNGSGSASEVWEIAPATTEGRRNEQEEENGIQVSGNVQSVLRTQAHSSSWAEIWDQ